MVIDIIYNIALLLSLGIVYAIYPFKSMVKLRRHMILLGVGIGLVGLLLMSRPFVLVEGIMFDGRSILVGATSMFFGPVPAVISSAMMIAYRIFLGGDGVHTGVAVIASTCLIGVLWHRMRFESVMARKKQTGFEFYLVGLAMHVVMLLCMLLVPRAYLGEVLQVMTAPILIVYPLGFYLLAMLLYNQMQRFETSDRLETSEQRFKTMFEQAPMGITVTDSVTGNIIEANSKFLEIVGMTRDTCMTVDWMTITHPDDLAEDMRLMRQLLDGEIESFTMDKRYIKSDGSFVWVNMAVTIIKTTGSDVRRHLCMVTDITARKESEVAILHANTHDHLTDLRNRQDFERYLRVVDRPENLPLTVAIGDINGLKLVNDAFGRDEGDRLLCRVARMVKIVLREGDYCARIGGDEIAVVMAKTDKATAESLVGEIQRRVAAEAVRNVEISMSFGMAVKSEASRDINELVKHAENDMNRSKLYENPSTRSKAVYTIINTLHEKSRREELHSRRVGVLASRLAEALGMGVKEVAELRTAGLLHDIGKIAIDESVLNKNGRLNEREWEQMRRHPETGYRILGSVSDLGELATVVLAHHERIDGRGYPRGLVGEEIPLQARIIAIADAYDAMTAERPYREPVEDREAANEIRRCAGTQFDSRLARVFVEQILELPWENGCQTTSV